MRELETKNIRLEFGAMAPKLSAQLKGKLIGPRELSVFQKDCDAVVRLSVRGLISDSERTRARKKILRRILEAVKP